MCASDSCIVRVTMQSSISSSGLGFAPNSVANLGRRLRKENRSTNGGVEVTRRLPTLPFEKRKRGPVLGEPAVRSLSVCVTVEGAPGGKSG